MHSDYKKQLVLVTGASKGIGREMVCRLVARGAIVGGIARSDSLLASLGNELRRKPGKFIPLRCNVSDREAMTKVILECSKSYGPVGMLINNAGLGLSGPAMQTGTEDAHRCFEVNFWGAINCIDAVAPMMISARSGTIVNVCSVVARYGLATVAYYSAAKAALSAFSQALRVELCPAGIKVITVYPGRTETGFHTSQVRAGGYVASEPSNPSMSAAFVADSILKAVDREKRQVTIGLASKVLLALERYFPRLVERKLIAEFKISDWYLNDS